MMTVVGNWDEVRHGRDEMASANIFIFFLDLLAGGFQSFLVLSGG